MKNKILITISLATIFCGSIFSVTINKSDLNKNSNVVVQKEDNLLNFENLSLKPKDYDQESILKEMQHDFIKNIKGGSEKINEISLNSFKLLDYPDNALIMFVDRNPAIQKAALGYSNENKEIFWIGEVRISTGNPNRSGYFLTPIGIFNALDKTGYRAMGTKNSKGVRGLGEKGARIWDFGWRPASKLDDKITHGSIRLQAHATDPDILEPLLGQRASKGCVRMSGSLNSFLERHSFLQSENVAGKGLKDYDLKIEKFPAKTLRLLAVVDSSLNFETQKELELVSKDWQGLVEVKRN